jgi:hypothetical protein
MDGCALLRSGALATNRQMALRIHRSDFTPTRGPQSAWDARK